MDGSMFNHLPEQMIGCGCALLALGAGLGIGALYLLHFFGSHLVVGWH